MSVDNVADIDPIDQYTATASQTDFDYSFPIFEDSDLVVYDNDTLMTLTTDYTVSGEGEDTGGTVTFTSGRTAGHIITIYRDVPIERTTDIQQNGTRSSTAMNDELDRMTMWMQQLERNIGRAIRLTLRNAQASADLEIDSNFEGKYLYINDDGELEPASAVATTTLTQSIIGELLYPQSAAEAVANVTPVDEHYYYGYMERYGGSTSQSAANNATALTNALATGHRVRFNARSGFYALTGRIVAPANSWITLEGAELRWSATAATGSNFLGVATRPGIEVTGNNFHLDGFGAITGPSTASYVSNECGIYMTGTSTSVRKSGFWVNGKIEFSKWGSYPILLQFVNRIEIVGPYIHDSGYIGIHMSSCDHGKIRHCEISTMTPGTGGEAQGISLSHDSTNYSADPNAGTNGRLAANPFCVDWDIDSNEVRDIVIWTGIDAHGGYEVTVRNNKIYNCLRGIQVASGSGGAINYAGEGNAVLFNKITPRKRDGSATGVSGTLLYGITVNGGSTVEHRGVRVIGNDIDGCGDPTATSASIMAQRVNGAVIQGNTIRNWAGPGIYVNNADGVISGNKFLSVSNASSARCIRLDADSRKWEVTGNGLELNGGTAPAEGLRVTTTTVRHVISGNNFATATTPYIGTTQTLAGAGAVDVVNETTFIATTGANALTLANCVEEGQTKYLVMTVDGGDGTLTPTNLYNGTTITFNDVGDSAFLKFMNGEWVFMGGTATLA